MTAKTLIAVAFRPNEIAAMMHALAHVNEAHHTTEMNWLGQRFAKIHKQLVIDGGSEVAGTYSPQAWTFEENHTAKTIGG